MNRNHSSSDPTPDWWLRIGFATAAAVIVVAWLLPPAPMSAETGGPPTVTAAALDQAELGPLADAIVITAISAEDGGDESTEFVGASIAAYER